MKKFDRLFILSLLLYSIVALLLGYGSYHQDERDQNAFRVDINRAMKEMQSLKDPSALDLSKYKLIQAIRYLDIEQQEASIVEAFYDFVQEDGVMIQPWYQDERLKGYLKFEYHMPRRNKEHLLMAQAGLLFMELFVLAILFYLRKRVILPFQQLSEMPLELAKGHGKKDIKIEKSRYYQDFLMGMGQLKDELELSKKRQLELLKEKKQLLLSLSHDIKTPLNLIRLYGRMLVEDHCDESDKNRYVSKIEEKSKEIEDYVNQIRLASREDIMDLEVQQGEFYLSDLMKKVLDVYQEQCKLRHIELCIGAYEDRLLKGDIDRVREIFDNLFENAYKYGDGRSIKITFYEEDYCQLIHFYNSGSIVNENEYNHLFDSFFRGTNALGKAGSGLGLYICKELMQKMDGAIYAKQEAEGMALILVFR